MKDENRSFSLDELNRLSNGDKKFVDEMVAIFIRTTDEGITDMEAAIKQNDLKLIASVAHKITPPCRHMGATALFNCLVSIENAIRNSDKSGNIEQLIEKAKKEKDIVINELNEETRKKDVTIIKKDVT